MRIRPTGDEEPRGERLSKQVQGKLGGHTVKPLHGDVLGWIPALFASPPRSTTPRMHPQWENAIEQAQGKHYHTFIDMCVTNPTDGRRAARNHLEREENSVLKTKKLTQQRETLEQEVRALRKQWQELDYGSPGALEKERELSANITQKQNELNRHSALDDQETEKLLFAWMLRELAENHVTQSDLVKDIWPNFAKRRDNLADEFTSFLKEKALSPAETLPKLINALIINSN